MSDGAHEGVTAARALRTVLGGAEQPKSHEQMGAAEFCSWIRSAPDRVAADGTDEGYTETGRVVAKFILRLVDEEPDAITLEPFELIDRAEQRFPEAKETIDELTGFLAGWAINAARRCVEMPPVPNPALLTFEGGEPDAPSG